MIARYTRPELGAVWTDEARMTAWRDVEVAAAEALEDGPTPEDLDDALLALLAAFHELPEVHGQNHTRARRLALRA